MLEHVVKQIKNMITLNQLRIQPRKRKDRKIRSPALKLLSYRKRLTTLKKHSKPFVKGICTKILIMKPKKPNSAQRKLAKVLLKTGRSIYVSIPGIGHNLNDHATVLVRGGNVPDLPSVSYKMIRGKYDLIGVKNRRTSPSKYGIKSKTLTKNV